MRAAASEGHVTSSPVIVRGLVKRYGRKSVVGPLDLELGAGSVTALVGPNGAGKTTFLQVLFGLVAPSEGDVRVVGLDPLRDRPELRLRASLVHDDLRLPPALRVDQVLEFFQRLHARWDVAECARLMERFAIPAEARVADLSRGAAGKLAFIVGASTKPELMGLDEPTSGLDPLVRREMLATIREMAQAGRTVLLSTHVMRDVDVVADRVLVMNRGVIVADGPPEALGARYRRVSLVFDGALPEEIPGALLVQRGAREIVATFASEGAPLPDELARIVGARDARVLPADFDETFTLLLEGGAA